MDFIDKNRNDKFSKLRGLDLKELIYQIECFDLEYRDTLNLPINLTFGTEIEYECFNKRLVDEFVNKNLKSWYSGYDGSVRSGGEVISPILTDNTESWNELKQICTFLKENKVMNERSGAHIHIGAHILRTNKENWINFIKLYTAYESIMFRFFYGDKINARGNIFEYAKPIAPKLYDCLKDLERKRTIMDFDMYIPTGKYYALSFGHVNFYDNFKQVKEKNTIELRCPNGTIEEVIWQNNINVFAKLILNAKSKKLDTDFLNYKLKDGVIDADTKFYMYDEIRLKTALEFVDLMFNNNLDKVYFLKQYLKGFSDNYGIHDLIPAKKFVK